MKELTKDEVRGLGHAVGLDIQDPELIEVTYSLNALLEDLDQMNPAGLGSGRTVAHPPATELGHRSGRADVLVMPTMETAAPKIEPDPIIDSKESSTRNRVGLTTSFSLASSPALSMCCGFTSENLPIGLQIGGKPFAEQTVLNVAYAYQQATDWHGRRPPI